MRENNLYNFYLALQTMMDRPLTVNDFNRYQDHYGRRIDGRMFITNPNDVKQPQQPTGTRYYAGSQQRTREQALAERSGSRKKPQNQRPRVRYI